MLLLLLVVVIESSKIPAVVNAAKNVAKHVMPKSPYSRFDHLPAYDPKKHDLTKMDPKNPGFNPKTLPDEIKVFFRKLTIF
jgi:hypothetical protein